MNRKYLTIFCFIVFGLNCPNVFGVTVFDPSNYARSLEILKSAKAQVEELDQMKREAQRTNQQIGDLRERAQHIGSALQDWRTYYNKIDTLGGDHFSILSLLDIDRHSPNNRALDAFKFIDERLFRTNFKPSSREEYAEISKKTIYEREKISRHSLVTGIMVAEKNKSDLGNSKTKIMDITNRSFNSKDMVSLIHAQNEMLGLIATELVMQRELQAQMLEFITTHASNQFGTGNNSTPKKPDSNKSFK